MSGELKTDPAERRETLREMLIRLQKETYQRIEELRRDQQQESDAGPADEMDSASTTGEIETHAGLIARAEEKLRYLDEAVERLDAGKYGRCLKCKELIPIERLEAIPFASYCVDCQRALHRARGGWGEGTTIAPYDQQWTVPDEMEEAPAREYRSTDPEEQLTIYPREPLAAGDSQNQSKRQSSRNKRTPARKR